MCVYVCVMCIYVYAYVYVCVCVCVHLCMYMYVCVHVCVHLCMCVHMHACIQYVFMCACVICYFQCTVYVITVVWKIFLWNYFLSIAFTLPVVITAEEVIKVDNKPFAFHNSFCLLKVKYSMLHV